MRLAEPILSPMRPPYKDLASYLAALKGDRSYEDLAKLAGTSPSVIHRAVKKGGTFPEGSARRLAKNLHLTPEDREFLMEMVGRARGLGNKFTQEWAASIEQRAREAEQQAYRLAKYVLSFPRNQLPHQLVERCEAIVEKLEHLDQ